MVALPAWAFRLVAVKAKRPERPAEWQRQMNLRLRAEFIAGAWDERRKRTGRSMTKDELEPVLLRYPEDV